MVDREERQEKREKGDLINGRTVRDPAGSFSISHNQKEEKKRRRRKSVAPSK